MSLSNSSNSRNKGIFLIFCAFILSSLIIIDFINFTLHNQNIRTVLFIPSNISYQVNFDYMITIYLLSFVSFAIGMYFLAQKKTKNYFNYLSICFFVLFSLLNSFYFILNGLEYSTRPGSFGSSVILSFFVCIFEIYFCFFTYQFMISPTIIQRIATVFLVIIIGIGILSFLILFLYLYSASLNGSQAVHILLLFRYR